MGGLPAGGLGGDPPGLPDAEPYAELSTAPTSPPPAPLAPGIPAAAVPPLPPPETLEDATELDEEPSPGVIVIVGPPPPADPDWAVPDPGVTLTPSAA